MKRVALGSEVRPSKSGLETTAVVACHDPALGLLLARTLELGHRSVTLIGSLSGLEATPPFHADVVVLDAGFWQEISRFGGRIAASRLAGLPLVLISDAAATELSTPVTVQLPCSTSVFEIVHVMLAQVRSLPRDRRAELPVPTVELHLPAKEGPHRVGDHSFRLYPTL